MKQGIVGFLLGILLAIAVFAYAGKPVAAESQIGRFQVVATPGFATKDNYQGPSAWKIDTLTGECTKIY